MASMTKLLLNINTLNFLISKESMQIFTKFHLQRAKKKDIF